MYGNCYSINLSVSLIALCTTFLHLLDIVGHIVYPILMRKLSILEQQLLDEYFRCLRNKDVQMAAVEDLPKGYISQKKRGGKTYSYLQWRDGDRIRSHYIKPEDLASVENQIESRKNWSDSIKQLEKNIRQIEKVLGKGLINEYSQVENKVEKGV